MVVTEFCNQQERMLVHILKSRSSSISGPQLAAALGTTDRQVRAMVNHLRKDHKLPVCSTPAEGFYWPRTRSSADHTLAQLISRRMELESVIEGILEGLDREFGPQLMLDMEAAG